MKEIIGKVEFELSQLQNGNVVGATYDKEYDDMHMIFGVVEGNKKRITHLRMSTEAAIMTAYLINKRLAENNITVTVSSDIRSDNVTVVMQKYRDA